MVSELNPQESEDAAPPRLAPLPEPSTSLEHPTDRAAADSARADAELLKAARHDPVAFRAFYDRWSEPVLAYFQRRVDDPQVALDLTAETFAIVFEKSAGFRWRGSSPGAWVFGIAKNLLRRYLRTLSIQRRAVDRLGVQLPDYDDQSLRRVEELVDNARLRALVQDALAGRSDADRRVLELRFVEGRGYAEIARTLGCSENAARVRCHRALTRLEKHLAETQQSLNGGGTNP